jgi:hypothetical protein
MLYERKEFSPRFITGGHAAGADPRSRAAKSNGFDATGNRCGGTVY